MMADHREPCGTSEASYCLNGGTCFKIESPVSTASCMCPPNFKGSRCGELQLPSSSPDIEQAGLIAAVVFVVLLILVVLVVIIYTCRKWRQKPKTPQNTNEYWKVARRV